MVSRGFSKAAALLVLAIGATAFVPNKGPASLAVRNVQSNGVQTIAGRDIILSGKVRCDLCGNCGIVWT